MKRILILLPVLALCLIPVMFIACSDNDDEVVATTVGSPDDPEVVLYLNVFEILDDATSSMFEVTSEVIIDSIANASPKPHVISDPDLTLTYHSTSKYWYCEFYSYNEADSMENYFLDSIQFVHNTYAVQWPDLDSLTLIKSYMTMVVASPHIDTGSAYQNITIALTPGSDIKTINGTQGIYAILESIDIDESEVDTTICAIELDNTAILTNLKISDDSDGPYDGSITYNGSIDVECTGANEMSLSGTWNTVATFTDDGPTLTITHGNVVWTITDW